MASEIRVDKITSLSGVGTITPSPTGIDIAGITTAATLRATTGIVTSLTAVSSAKVGSGVTLSPDGDIFATGVTTSTTFSGSGASLTNLNASNIASGTVPTARLGSGTASSSTFLRGDSTFAAVTSTTINTNADNRIITGSDTANTLNGESDLTFNGSKLSLSLAGGSNHIVELVNTSANSSEGTVLKLRASGRGGAEDNADVFLTTNNTDTRVFSVTNAGTVNTTGNIVMASGKGINFAATSDASGMTSELLDDYEEGTYTPAIVTNGTNPTLTYTSQVGRYTRVGNLVYVTFDVNYTNKTNNGSGTIFISLPITANSASVYHLSALRGARNTALPTSVTAYQGSHAIIPNSAYFEPNTNDGGGNATTITGGNLATSGRIVGSCVYQA